MLSPRMIHQGVLAVFCAMMAMPLHVMQYCYVMQLHMHFKDFKLSLFIGLLLELVTLQQHAQYAAAADPRALCQMHAVSLRLTPCLIVVAISLFWCNKQKAPNLTLQKSMLVSTA